MKQLLFFFLLIPCCLFAQTDFLKDPDIVWATEIEQDWVVDVPSLEDEWDMGIITLKQQRTRENELNWSSPYLADLVFEAVGKGTLPIFKDAQLKIPKNKLLDYLGVDTVLVFDPVTYEEQVKEIYNEPRPLIDVKAWRLRQVLAYHQKKAIWTTTTISIAPLVLVPKAQTNSMELIPAFWFKPDNKSQKLQSAGIVWAKKTVSGKQENTSVSPNDLSALKEIKSPRNPLEHQLKAFGTDMKIPFYDPLGNSLIPAEQRKSMLSRTDTIVAFDPGNYTETMEVRREEINADSISQLRLVQTWYWDAVRNRLSISLDAVAPMKNEYTEMGVLRCNRPLYYQKATR